MAYTGPDVPSSTGEHKAPLRHRRGVLARVSQKERTLESGSPKDKSKVLLKPTTVQKVISLLD